MELIELGTILEMRKGKKPVNQISEPKDGYLPYVDIDAFENGVIKQYTDGKKCTPCEDGDILIVCDGSRSGLVGRATKGYVGSTLAKISAHGLSSDFLYYFVQGKYALLNTRKKGTGTPHLNPELLRKQKLIVPNTTEQQRIVARIEELFSQLDDAEATLQKTKAQLAVYRQAVLKEAFEGKLTNDWREAHTNSCPEKDFSTIAIKNSTYKDVAGDEKGMLLQLPDSWLMLRIGDVFPVEVGATPSRQISEYWDGDVNWVSSGEVQFNHIYETKERITQLGLSNASTSVQPIGTVMLAMIGEGKTRGQAAILEVPAAHNQNTAAIPVSTTPCEPKYLYYYLLMNYENTRRVGSGNNQKALNKERVRALRFPFTSFSEQREIVYAIEARLSECDSIEKTVETALEQIKAIRQSILKKAFEGDI